MKNTVLIVIICLTVGMMGGCGKKMPEKYRVFGQITLDAMPIADGEIIFRSLGKAPSVTGKILQGKYECSPQGGDFSVEIYALRMPKKMDSPSGETPMPENYIPSRYNENTELKVVISKDIQENFELKSK